MDNKKLGATNDTECSYDVESSKSWPEDFDLINRLKTLSK
jgi:hypothetical protein